MSTRVAVYARVSTKDQDLTSQVLALTAFAIARGWGPIVVYEDKGYTAKHTKRPAMQRMLQDVKHRKIDVVLCYKLDRMFRSVSDLVVTLKDWQECGVDFVSMQDNIDLTTSAGKLMMHIIGAFAEFEANIISERTKDALAYAKSKGVTLGPRRTVSERSKLHALTLRQEGLSLRAICLKSGLTMGSVQRALQGAK